MNVGFKTGPRNWEEGKRIVRETGARLAEVWFNYNEATSYNEMFDWYAEHEVKLGLHYWGTVAGGIKPNLANENEQVLSETIQHIKATIDIAVQREFVYVNIHPGSRSLERIDFAANKQSLVQNSETPEEKAWDILVRAAKELHEYALSKEVLLTVETVPAREAKNYTKPDTIYDAHTVPIPVMENLAHEGIWIANDITHTASQFAIDASSFDDIWENVLEFSHRIASKTRLIHGNTMARTFTGTDTHDGVLDSDFQNNVFPNKDQLTQFLRIYASRDDVYVIPEPRQHMQENYLALEKIVQRV